MIYLDYNATSPVDARVLERLLPFFNHQFANASSTDHAAGNEARAAVERARSQVAKLISAQPEEITFTSGATESNNIAIEGAMRRAEPESELIVSAIEHPSVLEPARRLKERLKIVPVDERGLVDLQALRTLITSRTALVAVMAANNETGALQPINEIGGICADRGIAFHVDAVQGAARMPIDVDELHASTVAISAHKMYGPKGVGALFVRRRPPRAKLAPLAYGGGHERNLRPGTLNVPGIVGLGEASAVVKADREADRKRETGMRDRLVETLRTEVSTDLVLNSPLEACLPQTLNLRFPRISAAGILHAISDRVAIATGSACSTTSVEPSHVLAAQGLTRVEIAESIRISFGRQTTDRDLSDFVSILAAEVDELRLLDGTATRAA